MALAPVPTGTAAYDPKKIIGSLPQVDDSVAAQVTKLASQDSALNQMARTEGLKAANRRGLLNSTMAIGAAQDAVLQNVLPIAQQEAGQAFAKNQAAKAFEYGLTGQEAGQAWQTGERLGGQEFTAGENIAARGWQTAENIAQRGFLGTQADLDRTLQQTLQANQITADDVALVKQITSTEGIAEANNKLAELLQERDIEFRMSEGKLDRASAEKMQAADIAFQKAEGALNRSLQEQVAKWNLSSTDKAAAAQMLTSMETMYQNSYSSIMANTALKASDREKYLTAAKNLRDNQINFVEQMYNVDLKW